jgi:hypothetical protein
MKRTPYAVLLAAAAILALPRPGTPAAHANPPEPKSGITTQDNSTLRRGQDTVEGTATSAQEGSGVRQVTVRFLAPGGYEKYREVLDNTDCAGETCSDTFEWGFVVSNEINPDDYTLEACAYGNEAGSEGCGYVQHVTVE